MSIDQELERVPPHNLEAEQSALGAMMTAREAAEAGCEALTGGMFYREIHTVIFGAVQALVAKREPVDLTTMAGALKASGDFERVGGGQYLMALLGAVPTARNIANYAELVREDWQRRELLMIAAQVASDAYTRKDLSDTLAGAGQRLHALGTSRDATGLEKLTDLLLDATTEYWRLSQQETRVGLPTGIDALDKALGGLMPGELITIAARPGEGKTTLATNFAQGAIEAALAADEASPHIAFVSSEVASRDLAGKYLCQVSGVSHFRATRGYLTEPELQKLGDESIPVSEHGLWIDGSIAPTVGEIASRCRQMQREHGLDAVFVDYFQRLSHPRTSDLDHLNKGESAFALKNLALELNVPVVVLSQLNRRDGRPTLSSLKDTARLGEESSVVLFIDPVADEFEREEGTEDTGDPVDVIVEKQRNGPTGTVRIEFDKKAGRFA